MYSCIANLDLTADFHMVYSDSGSDNSGEVMGVLPDE